MGSGLLTCTTLPYTAREIRRKTRKEESAAEAVRCRVVSVANAHSELTLRRHRIPCRIFWCFNSDDDKDVGTDKSNVDGRGQPETKVPTSAMDVTGNANATDTARSATDVPNADQRGDVKGRSTERKGIAGRLQDRNPANWEVGTLGVRLVSGRCHSVIDLFVRSS